LKDIPEEAMRDLEVQFVERIDELLPLSLQPSSDATVDKTAPETEAVATSGEGGI
jgi:hypothetical protein